MGNDIDFCEHFEESVSFQWRIQDFPQGGVNLVGGVDSRGSYISKIFMSKRKNLDP